MVTYINRGKRDRYAGDSADLKPENVENGAWYYEINTGLKYMYSASDKTWYLQKDIGGEGGSGGTGTLDHSELGNKDLPDQHPIEAITGLKEALKGANWISKGFVSNSKADSITKVVSLPDGTVPDFKDQQMLIVTLIEGNTSRNVVLSFGGDHYLLANNYTENDGQTPDDVIGNLPKGYQCIIRIDGDYAYLMNADVSAPIHSTMSIEITDDGFDGYEAYYGLVPATANMINNHRNADGVVFCYYYDMDADVTYTYWYSNMESNRMPTFIRTYIEDGVTKQVLISIDVNGKATVQFRSADVAITKDGKVATNVNFDGYSLTGVQKFGTNGPAPLFIGSTIESKATNAPRITAATDGTLAVVKADTIDQYVPVSVGDPKDADHAVTKRYLDNVYKTEMIDYLKSPEGKQLIKDIVAGTV